MANQICRFKTTSVISTHTPVQSSRVVGEAGRRQRFLNCLYITAYNFRSWPNFDIGFPVFQGMLLANHLISEDFQDILLYCKYYCLLNVGQEQRIGQLVVWKEVNPYMYIEWLV